MILPRTTVPVAYERPHGTRADSGSSISFGGATSGVPSLGLGILEDLALVIADHHAVGVAAQHVIRA